jgi:hypothetical protein
MDGRVRTRAVPAPHGEHQLGIRLGDPFAAEKAHLVGFGIASKPSFPNTGPRDLSRSSLGRQVTTTQADVAAEPLEKGTLRAMRPLLVLALVFVPLASAAAHPGPADHGPPDDGPLPTRGGMTTISRIEPRFSKAAMLVSGGRRVEVRCWSVEDWGKLTLDRFLAGNLTGHNAYVNPNDPEPQTRLHVDPLTCTDLARLTYRKEWTPTTRNLALAIAVVELTHGAQHIRGTANERTAECWGVQRARIVARSLGLSLTEASKLVELYWRREYRANAASYRSAQCKQGGALDVNLSRSFP